MLQFRNLILLAGVVVSGVLGASSTLEAQHPDLLLTQAQRDSILKDYNNIFPLFGRKAIEKGFDLAKPAGVNIIGLAVKQGIDITDLGLSTGSNPIQPISAITFGKNSSTVYTGNLRAELWVLPFLSVYGLAGQARANTTVEVATPINFTTSVDQTGQYAGIGLTGAMGIKKNFAVADINWAWTKLEKLDEPVRSRVFSLRYGRTFKVDQKKRLNVWLGAMKVSFASETNGSINLSEAIPPETIDQIRDRLENVENQPWYQELTPAQKAVVNTIVDKMLATDGSDLTINYQLAKAPTKAWNMLAGGNLDFNKRWSLRSEIGFLERTSFLLNLAYRFDL
jgi:hypothetical protein